MSSESEMLKIILQNQVSILGILGIMNVKKGVPEVKEIHEIVEESNERIAVLTDTKEDEDGL